MKRQIVFVLVSLWIITFMAGCISAATPPEANFASVPPQQGVVAMALATPAQQANPGAREPGILRDGTDTQDRMIVRNATLSITLDDPAAKIDEIESLASEMGGWVVSANLSTSGTGDQQRVSSASISIRVEAARLDEALNRIKQGVGTVNSEAVTGEDVTAQYVDVSSRVANLEAAEQQLQAIMEDARRTEDVLAVFEQLTRLRGEIESLRGQMQYFEQSSSFSAIQVQLFATPITPPVEVGGWRPLDAVSAAAQALVNVVQSGVNILIFAAVFALPLALIIGLPTWFAVRLWRRRRTSRQTIAAQS